MVWQYRGMLESKKLNLSKKAWQFSYMLNREKLWRYDNSGHFSMLINARDVPKRKKLNLPEKVF